MKEVLNKSHWLQSRPGVFSEEYGNLKSHTVNDNSADTQVTVLFKFKSIDSRVFCWLRRIWHKLEYITFFVMHIRADKTTILFYYRSASHCQLDVMYCELS